MYSKVNLSCNYDKIGINKGGISLRSTLFSPLQKG